MKAYSVGSDCIPRWKNKIPRFYDSLFVEFYDNETKTGHWIKFLFENSSVFNYSRLVISYIFFDSNGSILGEQTVVDTENVKIGKNQFVIDTGQLFIDSKSTKGSIYGTQKICWDFSFSSGPASTRLLPYDFLYSSRSPLGKIISPAINLEVTGFMLIDSKKVEIKKAKGVLGHNYGTHYPDWWYWSHSSQADNGKHFVFEALSVKSGHLPCLTLLYLEYEELRLWFNKPFDMILNSGSIKKSNYTLLASANGYEVKISSNIKKLAGLFYTDPAKGTFTCLNNAKTEFKVEIYKKGLIRKNIVDTLSCHGTFEAAFLNKSNYNGLKYQMLFKALG